MQKSEWKDLEAAARSILTNEKQRVKKARTQPQGMETESSPAIGKK